MSFPEARKQFEQFYQARTYASAVKPGTCNKSTETDNKTTQTDNSFTEYLKQKAQEKQKEPAEGKPQEKSTSSSLPGPALKPATLEMIRKEGEKKRKRNSKNKKKTKDENNIIKKKKKQKKQYSLRKIHFLCLKRMMRKMTWTMILWFSQDSSSSDHLPKGTLSRLPTT